MRARRRTRWTALGPRAGHRGAPAPRLRPAGRRHRGGDRRANAATMRSTWRCCARIAAANRAWGTDDRASSAATPSPPGWRGRAGAARDEPRRRWPGSCSRKDGEARAGRGRPAQGRARLRGACRRGSPIAAGGCSRMRRPPALVAALAAGLRAGQAFALAYAAAKSGERRGRFRRSDPLGGAAAADARHGRLGALQARPGRPTISSSTRRRTPTRRNGTSCARSPSNISPAKGRSRRHRTIFTVGDYKQAIFGFQGTDPASVRHRPRLVRARGAGGRARLPRSVDGPQLPLGAADPCGGRPVIGDLGHDAFGLPRAAQPRTTPTMRSGPDR